MHDSLLLAGKSKFNDGAYLLIPTYRAASCYLADDMWLLSGVNSLFNRDIISHIR
jgi:hypothetical protein